MSKERVRRVAAGRGAGREGICMLPERTEGVGDRVALKCKQAQILNVIPQLAAAYRMTRGRVQRGQERGAPGLWDSLLLL